MLRRPLRAREGGGKGGRGGSGGGFHHGWRPGKGMHYQSAVGPGRAVPAGERLHISRQTPHTPHP